MAYSLTEEWKKYLNQRSTLTGTPTSPGALEDLRGAELKDLRERAYGDEQTRLKNESIKQSQEGLDIQRTEMEQNQAASLRNYDLAQKQIDQAEGAAKTSSMIQGAQGLITLDAVTGGTGAGLIKKGVLTGAEKAGSAMGLGTQTVMESTSIAGGTSAEALGVGLGSAETGAATEMAAVTGQVAAPTVGEVAATETGATLGTVGTSAAAGEGAASLGGAASAGLSALPWAVAGYYGAKLGGEILEKNAPTTFQERMGRTMQDPLQGIGKPWAKEIFGEDKYEKIEPVMEVLNPIGWVAKKAGCIIITACTDRNSPEVNIARQYRDHYMTIKEQRGYYRLAEKIAPLIYKYPLVKRFMYKHLVLNLIEYGKYALHKTDTTPSVVATLVTKTFLMVCGLLGNTHKQFTRCNGEVL